ncbi:MAG: cysteine--tRNA ligase [Halobacteriovoraceae bacterium]|nr:cysteine--tRNA ligase [Halobacteriovoraceae bacterium]|tara:strand:- start:101845 stop:103305 length:1461 start_codon:yes stop_codon:yes gene_type:complete
MALTLYNTLSKTKEKFESIEQGHVKMYVCGPTVYDYLHIGNFRGAIFFNLVRNWLEESGHKVTYVYNYTDVDDKIIERANERGIEPGELTAEFIKAFEEDYARLKLRPQSKNPRVTEHMDDIIDLVKGLVDKEKAYVVDGEVFFSIDNFPSYGQLSGKKLDELEAGQRVDVDERKRNPGDFVLWKPAKEGEPSWESPWGAGRPGWHIECSAMIKAILGESIDIHGGGIDLIFPHHENEIAQGEGCSGKKYCNFWMHNNFINLKDQKMSKSLGNFITARSFMDKYHPEILKYVMLSSHYRSMLNVNEEKIDQTVSALARVYKALREAKQFVEQSQLESGKPYKALDQAMNSADGKIKKALNDDFNTGEMMANIFEVVRVFNAQNISKKKKDPNALASATAFQDWIAKWANVSALFLEEPQTFLGELDQILIKEKGIDPSQIESLIEQRNKAREEKDWAKSDEARDKLLDLGIEISDSPEGTTWEVKK